ncbi:hypothetical protein GCM10007392_30680 [Saccharospirillum salsuginis]|uniref:Uncharacterized protein n=1 Tax=Saccharospirillum salsuginis TaxID=418750 RepID=A0A918KEM2_9GAMM|nr:hypothetical protein GCM10007392_30680 [Saccharospirillum salsuginis]
MPGLNQFDAGVTADVTGATGDENRHGGKLPKSGEYPSKLPLKTFSSNIYVGAHSVRDRSLAGNPSRKGLRSYNVK